MPTLSDHHGNISQTTDAFGWGMIKADQRRVWKNTLVLFVSDYSPIIGRRHCYGMAGAIRRKKVDSAKW